MFVVSHDKAWWKYEWAKLTVIICLALMLAAVAFDGRDAVLDGNSGPPEQAAHAVSLLTPDAMIRDMMEHD